MAVIWVGPKANLVFGPNPICKILEHMVGNVQTGKKKLQKGVKKITEGGKTSVKSLKTLSHLV